MALLDEWNQEISGVVAEPVSGQEVNVTSHLFSLDPRLDFASQGRGHTVAFASSRSKIFIATSKNYIIIHDDDTGMVREIELSKSHECKVRRLFVDPLGRKILVLLQQGLHLDTYYVDLKSCKPRLMKEMRGINVTSVTWAGWFGPGKGGGTLVYTSIIVGSDKSVLYGVGNIDSIKDKFVKILEIPNARQSPIAGLSHVYLGTENSWTQSLVLVLCGTHLHIFRGRHKEGISSMFQSTEAGGSVETRSFDLPIEQDAAQLQILRPLGSLGAVDGHLGRPDMFAILSTSGIYYGKFDFSGENADPMDYLSSHKLLPSSVLNKHGQDRPISLALTAYHIVLLCPSKIQFVNIESRSVVQEIAVDSFATPMRGASALPLGLTRDAIDGQLLVLAGDDLFEIDYSNEDRDMWITYLSKGKYKDALPFCRTAAQRNTAYLKEGERLFSEGSYIEAAALFGKCTKSTPSFEEFALRFMGLDDGKPMRTFLEARLGTLGKSDAVQSTMVATWLLELMLDDTNRLSLMSDETDFGRSTKGNVEMNQFLNKFVTVLDPNTTISILQDYGRVDELIEYARARGDHESEVELLVQRGDVERVFEILRKPSINRSLVYKYASGLIKLAPSQTVFSWMDASPPLDPLLLLPAMMPYAEVGSSEAARREVLRYLEFCIDVRGVSEPAIHDFNVSILSIDPQNEVNLIEKLNQCRDSLGKPLYDPVRALRLCSLRGRNKATIHLLAEVGMWRDAICKALELDFELARRTAKQYDGRDKDLKKSLWIEILRSLISKNVVDGSFEIKTVDVVKEIMDESNESVSLDDVLELFPTFEKMGNFKDLICDSLRKYSQNVNNMRSEMKLATESNARLREAVSKVSKPKAIVDPLETICISCSRQISERPPAAAGPSGGMLPSSYVFPTGNVYHGACLCFESGKLVEEEEKKVIKDLAKCLSKLQIIDDTNMQRVENWKKSLENLIALQDPFCGENVSCLVTKQFLDPSDSEDIWALG